MYLGYSVVWLVDTICFLECLGGNGLGIYPSGGKYCVESFFGTVVNAAYGISSQVSAAVYRFLGSFQTAVNPQLIKEYAQGNVMGMMGLAYRGMKFSFSCCCLSLIRWCWNGFHLKSMLGTVPELAPAFCRLVVANALLDILQVCLLHWLRLMERSGLPN